jgi:hypothetical protein
MKNITKRPMGLLAPAALVLAIGCKSKPVEVAPPPQPAARNAFLGVWVGDDKAGAIYTFKFANDLRWESHTEDRPLYRGTYEPQGSRMVQLKVLEEFDPAVLGWRQERGNMPPILTGQLLGSTLKLPNVLTEAELRKR